MKPIPKRLLIHSAVLYEKKENSWQERDLVELAKLTHVRVEPCTKLVTTSDNRSISLAAEMFYDCRNSSPKVDFKVGQRVRFGGQDYSVEVVETFCAASDKPHHLEVGLCL